MKIKHNKLIIAGGSGFLGQCLIDYLSDHFRETIVLTRGQSHQTQNVQYVHWDGENIGPWSDLLESAEVLINLCGRSVDCRYTDKNKDEILKSRIAPTMALGAAVILCQQPPRLWINAGSATIYKHTEVGEPNVEESEVCAGNFSEKVCMEWEQSFMEIPLPFTRKVILRTSLVLGKKGGVFPVLRKLSKLGVGGKMGSGNQYVSWLHEKDFAAIVLHCIAQPKISGVVNCTAPQPISNETFMSKLRSSLGVVLGLPSKKWMLEVGAKLLQTETELVLKSRKVFPKKLIDSGFQFYHPNLENALKNLES